MSNPILAAAPYLIVASQISRLAGDIAEALRAGKITPEEARAKWDATVPQVLTADARWVQADQAARSS